MVKLNIQINCKKKNNIPKKKQFLTWLEKILKKQELTIRIVDTKEIKFLNKKYRKINKSTNVLSFSLPKILNEKDNIYYLGDIIICHDYLKKEALMYKKKIIEHWAHIVLHSTLHLLKYTHDTPENQKKMEDIEIKIMLNLGYNNPYLQNS